MKIALLSGAFKNAGDFLIVERCQALLQDNFPQAEIVKYNRGESLDDYLADINKMDVLVLAGGPAYIDELYPEKIPLVSDLSRLKIPIFAMAMGQKLKDSSTPSVYNLRFSDSTRRLLDRIDADGFSFGCRDRLSAELLHQAGYKHTRLTGCAAWYDLKHVQEGALRSRGPARKICVSDPADPANYHQSIEVVRFLCHRFPKAEMNYVFHRGSRTDRYTSVVDGKYKEEIIGKLRRFGGGKVSGHCLRNRRFFRL